MGHETYPASLLRYWIFVFSYDVSQRTLKRECAKNRRKKGRKISDKKDFYGQSFNKFDRHKAEQSQQVRALKCEHTKESISI